MGFPSQKELLNKFFTIAKTNTNHNAKFAIFFIIFRISQSAASKFKNLPYTKVLSNAVQAITSNGQRNI
jgi:hypothetical protein